MSRYEFKLPDIGEGVTEGQIVKWLIAPGDVVVEDQPMVEVMTDKATVTITAPKAGKVLETRGKEDETVAVHAVLIVFDVGARRGGADSGPGGRTRGRRAPAATSRRGGHDSHRLARADRGHAGAQRRTRGRRRRSAATAAGDAAGPTGMNSWQGWPAAERRWPERARRAGR